MSIQLLRNTQKPCISIQYHFKKTKNSGIHTYIKCLESLLTIPTTAYNNQVEENKQLVNLKKLSNEIIIGKSTKDTMMELDREGVANYEQLKDLIHKKCDKHDRCYAQLEEKYNKLEHDITHTKQQQKHDKEGPPTDDRLSWHLEEKHI